MCFRGLETDKNFGTLQGSNFLTGEDLFDRSFAEPGECSSFYNRVSLSKFFERKSPVCGGFCDGPGSKGLPSGSPTFLRRFYLF